MSTIARNSTSASANAQRDALTEERVKQLECMLEMTGLLARAGDLETNLTAALEALVEFTGISRATLRRLDADGALRVVAAVGPRVREHNPVDILKPQGDSWKAVTTRQMVMDNNHQPGGRTNRTIPAGGNRSTLALPMAVVASVLGVLHLGSDQPGFFTAERVAFMQAVSARLGSILEKAQLRDDLRRQLSEASERAHKERAVLDAVGDGIMGTSLDGVTTFANPAACRILGYEADEIVGKKGHTLLHHSLEDGTPNPQETCVISRALSERRTIASDEETYWRKDGTPVPVRLTASPLEMEGALTGAVIVFQDMTEQREMERRRNAFVSSASHELRTPMTSIMGFTELLLKRDPGPETRHQWLSAIHEDVEHMAAIVGDLLDISRVQSGTVRMETGPVSLENLAREVVTALADRSSAHTLHVSATGTATALGDKGKLTQVLTNLVENAIKYSPDGGAVTVRLIEAVAGEAWVCVEDQGMGISARDASTLFSPFQRLQNDETAGIRGTGLGLYLVKTYVEQMGGRVWLESEKGEGSRFFVSLPVASA